MAQFQEIQVLAHAARHYGNYAVCSIALSKGTQQWL
jgi:hypothetical protein